MIVGSRYEAEVMTDLGDPSWDTVEQHDGTAGGGTDMRFEKTADQGDKLKQEVTTGQQVTQIKLRARDSGNGLGDDKLAVWIDGTASGNKAGTVLPPKGPSYGTLLLDLNSPLAAGKHTIYVGPNQANDAYIALDWFELHNGAATADTTPPETNITSADLGTTSDNTPTFTFAGSDNVGVTGFDCRTDGGAWASCSSPYTPPTLADGVHTFKVRAKDGAGNVDDTPASDSFTVDTTRSADTTAPETTITSGPAEGSTDADGNIRFSFSSDEAGSTFKCKMDGSAFASCASPKDYSGLANGSHHFEVRATDAASNTDATPATRNFTVDTTSPVTRVNVKDYGATSNDATNDTAAFKSAMDAAGPGEVVYVPAGTFRIDNLNIPSNTTVEIESTATIKKYGTNKGPVFTEQGVANTSFAHDIYVYGVNGKFTLDLSDAPQDTTGFRLRSVKNFSIKNLSEIGRDNDPSAADDPNGSITMPVISFLPMDTTKLNGEYEHPQGGVIQNVSATHQAFGWGLTQLTGAEDVHFQNISSNGGVALRLENYENNATTIDNVTADGVTCKNGHNAVNLNPHNADNGVVNITNVIADSCWQGISLADDPAYPDGNFDSTSVIDGTTVIHGNNAQVRDFSGPKVGSWKTGPSEWCVDADKGLVYGVKITNLNCGGLPDRNWP